jgi:hypothetical protein
MPAGRLGAEKQTPAHRDGASQTKVFISWSGERSRELAQALHGWIPLVLHNVEPWLSEADIEAGERWAEVVAKELSDSNFGIICVTRENVAPPWILFEAGALAKTMQGSTVIPLLLDLEFTDITGPLAQFQAKKVVKDGINEVMHSINQAVNFVVPEPRAKQLFDALWPELEKKVEAIPAEAPATKHPRPQHEILEELVASVRSLDSRMREGTDDGPFFPRHRNTKFRHMMVRDLMHMIGREGDYWARFLILASMFRDGMPWLYELGMEVYRTAKAGLPEDAHKAMRTFRQAAEVTMHGRFMGEEMGVHPRDMDMLVHELDRFMHREPEQLPLAQTKQKRKRKST